MSSQAPTFDDMEKKMANGVINPPQKKSNNIKLPKKMKSTSLSISFEQYLWIKNYSAINEQSMSVTFQEIFDFYFKEKEIKF